MKTSITVARRCLARSVVAVIFLSLIAVPVFGPARSGQAFAQTLISPADLSAQIYELLDRIEGLRDLLQQEAGEEVLGANTGPYQFLLSKSEDRSGAVPFNGSIVSGNIYPFVSDDSNIATVNFYLDDPSLKGTPLRTEIAPFDFGGGTLTTAYPFDTKQLPNGSHRADAKLSMKDGTSQKLKANFTVANGSQPAPTPTPTPTSTRPASYGLSVAKNGLGSGRVTSLPAGIDCGATCGYQYASGTVVQLTAVADSDSDFGGWTGVSDCSDGSVAVRSATSCTAIFNLKPAVPPPAAGTSTLTVVKLGIGSGSVTSEPGGLNCGSQCSAAYASGTVVVLTVTPSQDSIFAGWSGDPDCADSSVTLNVSRSCTATFNTSLVPTSSPQTIALSVNEYSGVGRNGEVLNSGVPLPQSLNLKDTSSLRVVNASGQAVPAQFRVIARWQGALSDTSKPIQWVLVTFPAGVSANSVSGYKLLTNGSGSNPAPAAPLSVSQSGNQVTINTGVATFVVGPNSLFDEIRTPSGQLVSGGNLSASFNGSTGGADSLRSVKIKSSGPLAAVVEVKGAYNLTIGSGAISFTRRYEFKAGSPTALVRHVVDWEGSFSGLSWWTNNSPSGFNFVEGQRVRDSLNLAFTPTSVRAVGSYDVTTDIPYSGQEIALRTLLRNKGADGTAARWQPRSFQITSGGNVLASGARNGVTASGKGADGGMLAMQGPNGTLAIALDHMQNYEPQALRLLPGNKAVIDIADDKFPLAFNQGFFANMAVSALPADASRADLNEKVWAPLNKPLRALPTAQWLNQTETWDKIPAGALPSAYASYSSLMPALLERTMSKEDHEGFQGLLTHGLWPRDWADYGSSPTSPSGEIGMGSPEWDSAFRGTTWTDYYSTTAAASMWSLTSGNPKYINELSVPAALRTLHTQILQGAPGDASPYLGQAPHGYSGYRSDFNSKHHYWDNIFLYYYLTGDETVTDIIQRGGVSQMNRYHAGEYYAQETGAPSALWLAAWRFLGNTVADPAVSTQFLSTFKQAANRIITDHYYELAYQGGTYGFLSEERPGSEPVFIETSPWTLAGYDMENVYWLMKMTNDAPVGPYAVTPSRVLRNVANQMVKILPSPTLTQADGTLLGGDGTIEGRWAREIEVKYSGPRVGGTVTSLVSVDKDGITLLYPGDKPYMAAFFSRAARLGAEPVVGNMAKSLTSFGLSRMSNMVLGKQAGLGVNRLVTAVAEESGF